MPEPRICEVGGKGMFLPFSEDEAVGANQTLRGFIYLVVLGWFFLGVALSSDAFMSGIEKITSQRMRVKHPNDKTRMITVAVWNDTVANLTLMAFGSSTPEILLSIIELLAAKFFMGELGANTIVGSASFNLLMIIGICISVIPSDEVRMIKEITVYHITAVFSVAAYFWLYFVLQVSSPNRVDAWEAILTFLFFPLLIGISYAADIGLFAGKDEARSVTDKQIAVELSEEEIAQYAENLKKKFGKDLPPEKVMKFLEAELAPKKSRANYRSAAVRGMAGRSTKAGTTDEKYQTQVENIERQSSLASSIGSQIVAGVRRSVEKLTGGGKPKKPQVFFDVPGNNLACLECCGSVQVPIKMLPSNKPCKIFYETREGSAKHTTEFIPKSGYIEFQPGTVEQTQYVPIEIIDDEEVEDDVEFYVDLFVQDDSCEIFGPTLVVTIIDDDDPGVLSWQDEQLPIRGHEIEVKVIRRRGACGKQVFKVSTEEGTAKPDVDYIPLDDEEVTMDFGEVEKSVVIQIPANSKRVRDGKEFRVVMKEVVGGAKFNENTDGGEEACICTLMFDGSNKALVANVKQNLTNNWESLKIGAGSYKAQFTDALYVGGSIEEHREASCGDLVLHYISMPWALLCAFIPPARYANGWLTFNGALAMIAFQTACIADLAELVGCCFDIPDAVTAISIVAMGTSLPDTFASKTAAENDEYADSSVTNVTGSNSVNVFMGLGIPWIMGVIYWGNEGTSEEWVTTIGGGRNGAKLLADNSGGGLIHYGEELGVSLIIYTCCAGVALSILAWRRKYIGGEFGGPSLYKYGSSLIFFLLWVAYLVISSWYSIKEERYWKDQAALSTTVAPR